MSKQARGGVGCARDILIAPPLMHLVTYVLGNCAGGGVVAHKSAELGYTRLSHPTVAAVRGILQGLSEREEQVVRMRYGIGTRLHSAHEISERLGVMPSQIERITLRVFRKLRETSLSGTTQERPAMRDSSAVSGRQPALPEEPRRPDDADYEGNPWDEV